ncbi:MAG: RcpC/CpaB family pilus assembly protein, partial [Actinomycetota bacterium]|nr:RcpC/CpaB family pilus assembly protein [Actinomycetota bacterium]
MTDVPSPPAARLAAPGWLDARFVAGVFLVLVSVVAGSTLIARADDTVGVYAVTRGVAAGEVLTTSDVSVIQVDLPEPARYVLAGGRTPEGQVLGRAVGAGELLAVEAVLPPDRLEPRRLVSLPVDRLHVSPGLRPGDLVDVYSSRGTAEQVVAADVVLEQARVVTAAQDDAALAAGGGLRAVVVEVAPEQVGPLVLALQGGRLDLVTVRGGQTPGRVDAAVSPVVDPAAGT